MNEEIQELHKEHLRLLGELLGAVSKAQKSSAEARDRLSVVLNDSHLKSLFTLMEEDMFFREAIHKTRY